MLIIGGSSEYLDIADKVFMMEDYVLKDITLDIADNQNEYMPASALKVEKLPRWVQERFMRTGPMGTYVKGGAGNRIREHLAVAEKSIVVGSYSFDVSKIETLISRPQLVAIAFIIRAVLNNNAASCFNLYEQVCDVYAKVQREGFESIYTNMFLITPEMDLPCLQDVLFAISRLRHIETVRGNEDDEDDGEAEDMTQFTQFNVELLSERS
ncbi:MAG: hypothetical protein ACOXZM_10060 [Eubacteriales bacterium]